MPKKNQAARPGRARTALGLLRRRRAGPADVAPPPARVTHEQIALRAYELHRSGAEGDALAHWLATERELVSS
jgi:hypothetical protein